MPARPRECPPIGQLPLIAAVVLVAWAYAGYPLFLASMARTAARRRSSPADALVSQDVEAVPTMTVVIAALDEADVIGRKLADVARSDYPADRLNVIVVADGSSDSTADIARAAGATVLTARERAGKAAAVNRGVAASTTELICLTDANCSLVPGALRALAAAFDAPDVAVVSGAKTVRGPGARGSGEGAYWSLESFVKRHESRLGCTTGAPGEVCGLRRSLVRPIPSGVLNDDYHLTCDALVRGLVVRYEPRAVAVEEVSLRVEDEFERRARVAAGTWQTTLAHLTLADPRRGWVALAFISHRVLRSLVVPPLLPALLIASILSARCSRFARVLLAGQAGVYAAGTVGLGCDARPVAVPAQFVLTNAATLAGAVRLLRRRQPLQWRRLPRAAWRTA